MEANSQHNIRIRISKIRNLEKTKLMLIAVLQDDVLRDVDGVVGYIVDLIDGYTVSPVGSERDYTGHFIRIEILVGVNFPKNYGPEPRQSHFNDCVQRFLESFKQTEIEGVVDFAHYKSAL